MDPGAEFQPAFKDLVLSVGACKLCVLNPGPKLDENPLNLLTSPIYLDDGALDKFGIDPPQLGASDLELAYLLRVGANDRDEDLKRG
jgi:hypothetical protein